MLEFLHIPCKIKAVALEEIRSYLFYGMPLPLANPGIGLWSLE